MRHKKVVLIAFASIVVVSLAGFKLHQNRQDNMQLEKLREELGCNRVTLDMRETDKYCNDYDLYKKDREAGKI